jgi:hypothetical protein
VNFLTGHNNDAGAFKLTGMDKTLENKNVKLYADGGVDLNYNSLISQVMATIH